MNKYIKYLFFLLLIVLLAKNICFAENASYNNKKKGKLVLIINSYCPNDILSNTNIIIRNILQIDSDIVIKKAYLYSNLSNDSNKWIKDFENIINPYRYNDSISAIVLLYDESLMTYKACNKKGIENIPVIANYCKGYTLDINKRCNNLHNITSKDFILTSDFLKGLPVTGIVKEFNIMGNFEFMLKTNPKINSIAIITSRNYSGIFINTQCRKILEQNFPTIKGIYYDERYISTDEIIKQTKMLTTNTGILFYDLGRNYYEDFYSSERVLKELSENANSPIYSFYDFGITKKNVLGGYYNDLDFWGLKSSKIIEQILKGAIYKNIPLSSIKESLFNADWFTMNKFNIPKHLFPDNTIFVNKPSMIFETNTNVTVMIISLIIIILVLIFFVFISTKKLKKERKEIKKANKELCKSQKRLEVAIKKLKESDKPEFDFLTNISHEIRTPLNAIVGFSNLITKKNISPEEKEKFVHIIEYSNELLLQLINDILELSKIDAGIYEFNYEKVNVSNVIKELYDMFLYKLETNIILNVDIPNENHTIYTDKKRFKQIGINFITNAIKFTTKGFITIGFVIEKNKTILYCRNTGEEITKDKIDIIFDRFVKLNNITSGMDLGLKICKEIATKLGVDIGAKSKREEGNEFWISIPNN